jgi:hypothetical protein
VAAELAFALEALPSTLRVTGGREIPFARPVLVLRNTGDRPATGLVAHATLSEERGLAHDATETLGRSVPAAAFPPGAEIRWDLYEVLLAAHPGVGSKVRLWGHRAILGWWIDCCAWAAHSAAHDTAERKAARWRFRWSPAGAQSEGVELSVEAL